MSKLNTSINCCATSLSFYTKSCTAKNFQLRFELENWRKGVTRSRCWAKSWRNLTCKHRAKIMLQICFKLHFEFPHLMQLLRTLFHSQKLKQELELAVAHLAPRLNGPCWRWSSHLHPQCNWVQDTVQCKVHCTLHCKSCNIQSALKHPTIVRFDLTADCHIIHFQDKKEKEAEKRKQN